MSLQLLDGLANLVAKEARAAAKKRGTPYISKCHTGRTCFNEVGDNLRNAGVKIQ